MPSLQALILRRCCCGTVGKRSRDKGQRGEREAAALLSSLGFTEACRGLGQARAGGEVPDVDGSPWWVEVKRHRGIAAVRFLEQAELAAQASGDPRPPLVLMREDARPGKGVRWVAMLSFEEFAKMIAKETP